MAIGKLCISKFKKNYWPSNRLKTSKINSKRTFYRRSRSLCMRIWNITIELWEKQATAAGGSSVQWYYRLEKLIARRRRRREGERSRERIGGASRRGREVAAAAMNHTHAALKVGGWWVAGGLASGGRPTRTKSILYSHAQAGTTRAAPTWCPPSDDGDRGGGTTCDPPDRAGVRARLSEWTWKRNGGGRCGRAVGCASASARAIRTLLPDAETGKNIYKRPSRGSYPLTLACDCLLRRYARVNDALWRPRSRVWFKCYVLFCFPPKNKTFMLHSLMLEPQAFNTIVLVSTYRLESIIIGV